MRTLAFFTLIAITCIASTGLAQSITSLPEAALEMLRKNNIAEDSLGVQVVRISDGQSVFVHGDDRPMSPASTMKVLTSIAALETLGPTYRGAVELRTTAAFTRDGAPVNAAERYFGGVLNGNLYLRGLGNTDFAWEDFAQLLQTLRNKGVHTIHGNLVVDRNFYHPQRMDIGEVPFDETPEFRYNVIPDALMLNSNLIQFDIESSQTYQFVEMVPALERVSVVSKMKLIDTPCDKWEGTWIIPTVEKNRNGKIEIQLRGEFPRGCSVSTNLNIVDRRDYVDRLFRSVWKKMGGRFRGNVVDGDTPTRARLISEHRSRTLAEVIRDVNKRSDNPITRMIFLAMGAQNKKYQHSEIAETQGNTSAFNTNKLQTTTVSADRVVRDWMKKNGIGDDGLVLENGSGLSRTERIKPSQLAAVLRAAYASKWSPEFLASLPIVAVDGAMRHRLKASSFAERARFKTGTLRDVIAIAGIAPDAKNELHAVVVMLNHPKAQGAIGRPIVDAVAEWVGRSDMSLTRREMRDTKEQSITQ